jgi:hypothetical protein
VVKRDLYQVDVGNERYFVFAVSHMVALEIGVRFAEWDFNQVPDTVRVKQLAGRVLESSDVPYDEQQA